MTIINAKDLDQQMRKTIDPQSIPKHNGGDHGVMEDRFLPQSEHVETQQGHGRRGATEISAGEAPRPGYYGSQTVVSLSDLEGVEQLPAGMEPKPPGAPATNGTGSAPVPPPQQTVFRQRTAQEVIAQIGLSHKPKG